MIEFDDVTKVFDQHDNAGLQRVTFKLEYGELAFLTGHSGAGKTTLLRLIVMLESPTYGEISVGGYVLNALRAGQIPFLRRNIGYVCQDHNLLMDKTVYENVAIALLVSGFKTTEIPSRVRASLDLVGLLGKENLLAGKLSCGEQQRAIIARAVVNRPAILLADEPTGNLDPKLSHDIMHLLDRFHKTGTTVLIATHDISQIQQFNHRVLTLDKGQLISN